MEIIKQWIVEEYKHLVLLSDGSYRIGGTMGVYGFDIVSKEEAEKLITPQRSL